MTIEELKEKGLLLYEIIGGSNMYGLNTEGSDVDMYGVYIGEGKVITNSIPKSDTNPVKIDQTYYELQYFLELAKRGAPQAIEMLFAPAGNVKYTHDAFVRVINQRRDFLTQNLRYSVLYPSYKTVSEVVILNELQPKKPIDFYVSFGSAYGINNGKLLTAAIPSMAGEKYQSDYFVFMEVPNTSSVYNVHYCWRDHHERSANKKDTHQYPKALFNPDGTPVIFNVENKNDYRLVPIGYAWFNAEAYKKYLSLWEKKTKINNKKVAHALRLIIQTESLLKEKVFPTKYPSAAFYQGLRNGLIPTELIKTSLEDRTAELEEQLKKLPLVNDRLVELLGKAVETAFYKAEPEYVNC